MDYVYKNAVLQSDFQCFAYTTKPPIVTLHEHDFCELLLFLSGEISYHVAGTTYKLQPKDLVIVKNRVLHQPYFQSSSEYQRVVIWVKQQYLKQISTEKTDLLTCFEGENGNAVLALQEEEFQYFMSLSHKLLHAEDVYGGDVEAQCALMNLLVFVNKLFIAKQGSKMQGEKNRYKRVLTYIQAHFQEEITLDDLAACCYLSKYHFAREFKREYGITAYAYLNKVRLAEAKRLIPAGLPMSEIAGMCGFNDYNAFVKAFKQEYGTKPTTFLKMVRQNIL